ncbi:uncharacterized protein LOC124289669 [Haliotis rubra]|uniref:uncharacterized protein LOC124289669 n=1 Tax=Haliotis rubra TaxID=36100 RepID=UPI001EE50F6E|nr:uncharacterized protein LOC124289669 [Haliotis rubra]
MPSKLTDLDDVIKKWAWATFIKTKGQHDYNDYQLHVVWDGVRFSTEQPTYFFGRYDYKTPRSTSLFKANYDNHTDVTHDHEIREQRTTSATARVVIKLGFCRGADVGIKLTAPEDVAGAFNNGIFIAGEGDNRADNSISWVIKYSVTAPPMRRTTAMVRVVEKRFKCRFRTTVGIQGRVVVLVVNTTDNSQVRIQVEGDIATIIGDAIYRREIYFPNCVYVQGDMVKWPVIGKLHVSHGVSQEMDLAQEQLPTGVDSRT